MKIVSIAGSPAGAADYVEGSGPDARFDGPRGIALDPLDDHLLYICDYNNDAVRTLNLNTGAVSTLVGSLATHPYHVAADDDWIMVTGRGGPDDNNPVNLAGPYRIWAIARDGTIDGEHTPAACPGTIAKLPATGYWWGKYPVLDYSSGWARLSYSGGTFTLADDGLLNDSAYATDCGMAAVGTRVWKQHDYGGFSRDDTSDFYYHPDANAHVREYAPSPWPPTGQYALLGPCDAGIQQLVVTDTDFIGHSIIGLGFDATAFYGVASMAASGNLLFSGVNQIWMTDLTGSWHTRRT